MKKQVTSTISRRAFLGVGVGAAAVVGAGIRPARAATASREGLATLIDLSLCDGCTDRDTPACVSACKAINADRIPPVTNPIPEPWPRKTIEDWSHKRDVTNRLTPYNFIYVHRADIAEGTGMRTVYVPRRCMHCDNPACATICPFAANNKRKNGAVIIDQNLCFGGAKCRDVCPWEIPQRQSGVGIYLQVLPGLMGNGVMYKCDLCNDRLLAGKLPACIQACPRQAMSIGPRAEIEAMADTRARDINGHIYGRDENDGTATLYVSPVDFTRINETIAPKPGQPHMQPRARRRMASTDPLGKAVLAAPVLGLAWAGLTGLAGWFSKRKAALTGRKEQSHE